MKNQMLKLTILLLGFLMGLQGVVFAQTGAEMLAQLEEEDQEALEALALYPDNTRRAILQTTLHPEALVKLERLQTKSSEAFQDLMKSYPQSTQELVWDLTRYPGLVDALVTRQNVSDLLKEYPEDIEDKAWEARQNHFPLLVGIADLDNNTGEAFDMMLDNYGPATQTALRELVKLPEVLSLLTENIRLTVIVGDAYRHDPAGVLSEMDRLNIELAEENSKEFQDWKTGLEQDPEAMEALKTSALEYADEYGYDDVYYDGDDGYYDDGPDRYVVERHHHHYYPYWFGYPYWYEYPRWRPRPVWYDTGFYLTRTGRVVFIGMPSYYYTNWYFFQPRHHYYYPYLSTYYVTHYNRWRRRSCSSITTTVVVWQRQNREVITERWLTEPKQMRTRFKEYGEFEMERTKYNQRNPNKQLSKAEYLDRNTRKYPELVRNKPEPQVRAKPAVRKERTEKQPTNVRPSEQPTRQPKADTRKPADQTRKPKADKPPTVRDNKEPVRKETREINVPRTDRQVDKGRDYHRNTWERTRSKQQPTRTQPSTTRTQPSRTTPPKTTRKTTPKKNKRDNK
jgi:hypothetical protein